MVFPILIQPHFDLASVRIMPNRIMKQIHDRSLHKIFVKVKFQILQTVLDFEREAISLILRLIHDIGYGLSEKAADSHFLFFKLPCAKLQFTGKIQIIHKPTEPDSLCLNGLRSLPDLFLPS